MAALIAVSALALTALVALALLAARHAGLRDRSRALEADAAAAEKEAAAARRHLAQTEVDQQFLVRVLRELPHAAHELHNGVGGRQIPKLLLAFLVRMLEPKKALVAVRRRASESDPERHNRLAVAAVAPEGFCPLGTEVTIGRGEIGFAAEVQRVMDRRDFDTHASGVRIRFHEGDAGVGLHADVVAPMVFGEETVGVIALEGLKRAVSDAKDVLRLIAQVGALSVHTHARYTEMKATASIDGLTGVFNKRFLTHRLAEEIQNALRETNPVSIFLFDVDHFKHYNDRNGHLAGDRLLQKLARIVQENVRQGTVFGRYGGEEFMLVFPGTTREQALAAAENVRRTIAAHEFAYGFDQPLGCVSVSGGVAECPTDGSTSAALVLAADEALYAAKRAGRNNVFAFEPRYLGGDEAQQPVHPDAAEPGDRIRPDLPAPVVTGDEPLALAAVCATPPSGIPTIPPAGGAGARHGAGQGEEMIVVDADEIDEPEAPAPPPTRA